MAGVSVSPYIMLVNGGFLSPAEGFQISDQWQQYVWVCVGVYPPGCPTMHDTPTNNRAISLAPFLPLHSPCLGLQRLQSCSQFFKSFPVWIWLMVSSSSGPHLLSIMEGFFGVSLYWWSFVSSCIIGLIKTVILNLPGYRVGGGSSRAYCWASFSCFFFYCIQDTLRISCLSQSVDSGLALLTLSHFTDVTFAFTEKFPFHKLWKIYL